MGLKLVPVRVDDEGLAPDAAQWREPPRAMFVSPSHQYPTGAVMSHGRRRQLLDYAALHGVWVIEDDYDSEFRYDARPLPALQGLDEQGRVIYLGTFSKTLFPALRLAYLVLPTDTGRAPSRRALNELYREGQTPQQGGARALHRRRPLRQPHPPHARRLRRPPRRADRRHRPPLRQAPAGDRRRRRPASGARPAAAQSTTRPCARGRSGVTTRPLSLFDAQAQRPRGLLLGYGAVREEEIAANFARLAEVVQSLL